MKRLSRNLTAILSLLVMLAVLSTATFAWYTVINRVSGGSINFTAAINEGGGDLAIGWRREDTTSFSLTFDEPNIDFYPMIPRNIASIDVTRYQDFVAGNFNSSNQTKNTLGEWICSVPGQDIDPYICTGTVGSTKQNYFYLINRSDTYNMDVSVVYDIMGSDLGSKLRVAIFVGSSTGSQLLKGIMASNNDIHYGNIVSGQKVDDILTMPEIYRQTLAITFPVPKEDYAIISLVAWLDGAVMTDDDAEQNVTFGLRFDGIAVV